MMKFPKQNFQQKILIAIQIYLIASARSPVTGQQPNPSLRVNMEFPIFHLKFFRFYPICQPFILYSNKNIQQLLSQQDFFIRVMTNDTIYTRPTCIIFLIFSMNSIQYRCKSALEISSTYYYTDVCVWLWLVCIYVCLLSKNIVIRDYSPFFYNSTKYVHTTTCMLYRSIIKI
jgi:hypothetical protein